MAIDASQTRSARHTTTIVNSFSGTNLILIYASLPQTLLRELEFKKPQLDDLVNTAESLKTDANKLQLQNKGNANKFITVDLAINYLVIGSIRSLLRMCKGLSTRLPANVRAYEVINNFRLFSAAPCVVIFNHLPSA